MKWIPVTERLPDEERYYHTKGSHMCCYWHDDSKMFDLKRVTHWLDESSTSIEEDFKEYMIEARDLFVMEINEQEWNTKLRTSAEDLLICFDQMRERLLSTSIPSSSVIGENEAIGERKFTLKEALDIWEAAEDWIYETTSEMVIEPTKLPNRQQYFKDTFGIDI